MGGLVRQADFLFSKWAGELLSVLRIVTAFLFMQHGTQKLFSLPVPARGDFDPFSLIGVAGILEGFGGALILVGLFTRPLSFVMSGMMAVAYFLVFAPRGFWTIGNGGDAAVLYCFVFLYLAAAGGGSWSLDHLWRRSKSRPG